MRANLLDRPAPHDYRRSCNTMLSADPFASMPQLGGPSTTCVKAVSRGLRRSNPSAIHCQLPGLSSLRRTCVDTVAPSHKLGDSWAISPSSLSVDVRSIEASKGGCPADTPKADYDANGSRPTWQDAGVSGPPREHGCDCCSATSMVEGGSSVSVCVRTHDLRHNGSAFSACHLIASA